VVFLDHAEGEIRAFLGTIRRVLFVPFALFDRDAYAARARSRFAMMGYELDSIHEAADKPQAVKDAAAIFIGGGNTFRLLTTLYEYQILTLIRERVEDGMPYVGSSAGRTLPARQLKQLTTCPSLSLHPFRP
jgi:dipeptidase E